MTLSSCSSVSMVEKSSSGMMFEGNTMRPCRFRTNAFTRVLSVSGGSAGGAFHPALDGGDETGAQLRGGDDRVQRAHPAGQLDVVDGIALRADLAPTLRPYRPAEGRQMRRQGG